MKLARFGDPQQEIPAVLHENRWFDISEITSNIDGRFLESGGIEKVAAALEARTLPQMDVADTRIGPPIDRPSAIICIGQNYAAHAAESGSAPPEQPIIFLKPPNTMVGPQDPVAIPRGATKTDWEVELGVVIGRRA